MGWPRPRVAVRRELLATLFSCPAFSFPECREIFWEGLCVMPKLLKPHGAIGGPCRLLSNTHTFSSVPPAMRASTNGYKLVTSARLQVMGCTLPSLGLR